MSRRHRAKCDRCGRGRWVMIKAGKGLCSGCLSRPKKKKKSKERMTSVSW